MDNNIIMFWVGIVTFFIMLVIKIPIKKLTWEIADRIDAYDMDRYDIYRKLNSILILIVFILSFVLYGAVLIWLGDSHIKLCCCFKGAAIAIALYAVVEQVSGNMFSKEDE